MRTKVATSKNEKKKKNTDSRIHGVQEYAPVAWKNAPKTCSRESVEVRERVSASVGVTGGVESTSKDPSPHLFVDLHGKAAYKGSLGKADKKFSLNADEAPDCSLRAEGTGEVKANLELATTIKSQSEPGQKSVEVSNRINTQVQANASLDARATVRGEEIGHKNLFSYSSASEKFPVGETAKCRIVKKNNFLENSTVKEKTTTRLDDGTELERKAEELFGEAAPVPGGTLGVAVAIARGDAEGVKAATVGAVASTVTKGCVMVFGTQTTTAVSTTCFFWTTVTTTTVCPPVAVVAGVSCAVAYVAKKLWKLR